MIQWYSRLRNPDASVSITFVRYRSNGRQYMCVMFRNGLGEALAGIKMRVGYDAEQKRIYFKADESGWKVTKNGCNYAIRCPAFEDAGQFRGWHEWLYDKEADMNYVEVSK